MADEPNGKNGNGNGNGDDKKKSPDTNGSGDDKTFSQDQVNRLVGDRAVRAGSAKEKEILESLGVESVEDAVKLLEAQRKREDAEKSELEKSKEAKEAAEKREKEAIARADERLIQAEFIVEASRANVEHPDDAYQLADKSQVKLDKDGKVEGVADAVKTLVEAGRLPLIGKKKAADLDGGEGDGDGKKPEKLTDEEAEYAKKMGVSAADYRTAKSTVTSFEPEKKKEKKKE